jgi:WD40 repeat protein
LGDRALISSAKPITLLDNDSQPEPDLAVVQPLGREYLDHHPYPENIFWVVEYADTSLDKDATVKYHLYAAAGIREKIATLGNADNSGVLSLAFSPDSRTLATGDTYSRVKLWDVASQREIATLWNLAQRQERWTKTIAENVRVEDVVFLQDGQTLATIVNGLNRYHPFVASKTPPPTNLTVSALMVWDAASGKELQVMGIEAANRYALSLSADGRQLVTCGTTIDKLEELQNFVQLWDLETGEEVADLQYAGEGMLKTLDVAFSPTHPTVAFGLEETVQLWNVSEWGEPSSR